MHVYKNLAKMLNLILKFAIFGQKHVVSPKSDVHCHTLEYTSTSLRCGEKLTNGSEQNKTLQLILGFSFGVCFFFFTIGAVIQWSLY